MDSHDHISVIEALSCLGDLPLNHLSKLLTRLQPTHISARETLFRQDDPANQVYFVGSGRLAKFTDETFTGRLQRGEMAGWNSFLHQCPRDHTLIAENDCYLYALSRKDMDALVVEHPGLLAGFLTAATPLPTTGLPAAGIHTNRRVGIFTFGDLREQAGRAFEHLLACYNNHSRVTRYSYAEFCQLAGEGHGDGPAPDLSSSLAADVFAHLESENDTVFYTATAGDPPVWLQKITRQSDTLIVVVRDTTATLPDWFIDFIKRAHSKPGLVILRTEPGSFDRRVLALWDLFEPEWHYRLHLDDQARWASVGRMALGQAVNVILSGGGCLGAIHCGILQALTDAGFPIDTIGGTSAGAGIANGFALGDTPEVVAEKFRYAFTTKKPFKAYTLPYYGLINPQRLDRVLREIAEDRLLEESHIPTYATVANLTQSCLEVITTGPSWEAMRMTGSLPGILPAYIRQNCAYIDGGVVDNFPVSVARQKYNGRYVGVTFNILRDRQIQSRYEELPNAFRATLSKLKIGKPNDFPGLNDVLISSVMLDSISRLKESMGRVDLLLHPPVPPDIKITSFERFDELFEMGLAYGKKYVANLKSPYTVTELAVFQKEKSIT